VDEGENNPIEIVVGFVMDALDNAFLLIAIAVTVVVAGMVVHSLVQWMGGRGGIGDLAVKMVAGSVGIIFVWWLQQVIEF
jgi:hypothetical protein